MSLMLPAGESPNDSSSSLKRTAADELDDRPVQKMKLTESELEAASVPLEMRNVNGSHAGVQNAQESILTEPLGQVVSLNTSDQNDHQWNEETHGSPRTSQEDLPLPDEGAPPTDPNVKDGPDPPMSKNQQKRLRKKFEWESKREERKIIRKEKVVAKRERRKAARAQKRAVEEADQPQPPPAKKIKQQRPVQVPVTVLIDCDFDDLMRDGERMSLASQITRSYSDNRSSMFRVHLTVCSFGGKLRERFDNILSHYKGWKGVRFLESDFVAASAQAKEWMLNERTGGRLAGTFSHFSDPDEDAQARLREEGEVVYLSSEAEETLYELKPYSTYIIGGLVDKNREKGICYKRAKERGIRTAKLPIGEFMHMQSRKVLATNHVNEIMLKWLGCRDWGEAFVKVIPKRKGGTLKGDAAKGGVGDVENAESENGDAVEDCEGDGESEGDEDEVPKVIEQGSRECEGSDNDEDSDGANERSVTDRASGHGEVEASIAD